MAYEGKVDWAFGELLALGSLVAEGKLIRLSGQDTRRGTFSQRHSVIIDRHNGEEFTPLQLLATNPDGTPTGGKFLVYDSPLSEYAAVGFEYGYTVGNPDALVLWEGQFGDFVNGAQSIIDEFISSGEAKWGQLSNVVLLLPHGHEGQGPDHTSGRIERFLQLWAEGSMTIAVPSTPSNYFHLLRRHALDGVQRPLIVFTPKSMLRNKAAVSDIRDFTELKFRSVLEEPTYEEGIGDRSKVSRVLLTSGKIYYELVARKAKDNRDDVAIVRIEQLAPLPRGRLERTLDSYENATQFFWVQEEPANQGAWPRFGLELPELLSGKVGRDQAHLAPGDVGPVVGFVEGARSRAAGDPRHGVRLSPVTASAGTARGWAHLPLAGENRAIEPSLDPATRRYQGPLVPVTSTQLQTREKVLMRGFAGKVAVVTGAGSGIGQALAIELGRSGASVAISDVDTEGLAQTEEQLKAIGAPVKADRLDVTEREAFLLYADAVNEHFGKVNQIYNNAGIAFTGDIEVSQFKDIERVMDVDFWGVVNGTKAFLPHLIASGDGHVVNVSSVFGLFAVPGQAAYNSAKFAVRGFTEALRQEMMLARHPVQVTTVHPGGIKTAIARNAGAAEGLDSEQLAKLFDKKLAKTSPRRAAEIILDAVSKNRARVLVGATPRSWTCWYG